MHFRLFDCAFQVVFGLWGAVGHSHTGTSRPLCVGV